MKFLTFITIVGFYIFNASHLNAEQKIFSFFQNNNNENQIDYKFFQNVVEKVQREYVKDIPEKNLVENALRGILSSLDPYSDFLNSKEYKEMKTITRGEFGGLGIEVIMEQGILKVISPYENAPAIKAGVRSGDYIVMIDGESVNGLTMTEALEKLKGAPGTYVKIKVYRENGETKEMSIKREIINLLPAEVIHFNNDNVAYVKIGNFNEKTASIIGNDLQSIFKKHKNIIGIILDLRWNPGGLFEQATQITDLFLNQGRIVSIRGRNKDINIYDAEEGDIANGLPMVVLINNGSASASEIVAGALQDNKRAIIMGSKSFGKGSVQSVIPFDNGTAIKLTTAYFYTPNGNPIQNEGIKPNIEVKEDVKIIDESSPEKKSNNKKNILSNTRKKNNKSEDYQLQRAIDLIKGMHIYSTENL